MLKILMRNAWILILLQSSVLAAAEENFEFAGSTQDAAAFKEALTIANRFMDAIDTNRVADAMKEVYITKRQHKAKSAFIDQEREKLHDAWKQIQEAVGVQSENMTDLDLDDWDSERLKDAWAKMQAALGMNTNLVKVFSRIGEAPSEAPAVNEFTIQHHYNRIAPFGDFVSRQVVGGKIQSGLPNQPDGKYAFVQYDYNFAKKDNVGLNVVVRLDEKQGAKVFALQTRSTFRMRTTTQEQPKE